MRVLGIDPGYERLGVAVLERIEHKETVLFSTCVQTDKHEALPDRLWQLGQAVEKLLKTHRPTHVALETLFFNQNQKTGIAVAQARGVVIYAAKQADLTICEYGPQEVKTAVTGYGKSDKLAVVSMVKKLAIGVPEKAFDDEYDAIAVGLTCLAVSRS